MKSLAAALALLCLPPMTSRAADSLPWASFGSVFNLLDWSALNVPNSFPTFDFSLPTLDAGLVWDTSIFTTGVVTLPGDEPTDGSDDSDPTDDGDIDVIFTTTGFKDADKDRMEDTWEEDNGLDPANAKDAKLDGDKDGLTNLQEFQFGSDPKLADSDEGGTTDFDEWVLNTTIKQVMDAIFGAGSGGPTIPGFPGGSAGSTLSLVSHLTLQDEIPEIWDDLEDGVTEEEGSIVSVSSGGHLTGFGTPCPAPPSAGSLKANNTTAGTATTGTGVDTLGGIPVTDQTIATAKVLLFDLLDILPLVSTTGYDPLGKEDDEDAALVVTKLTKAKLWEPLAGYTTGKMTLQNVLNLLFGITIPNTKGVTNGIASQSGAASGSSTAAASAAKTSTTTSGKSGGGGLTGTIPVPTKNKAGAGGMTAGNAAGSNQVGGGSSSGLSSGKHSGSSGSHSVVSVVHHVNVSTSTSRGNAAPVTHSSHSGSSSDHHKDHGSNSGPSVRTGKKLSKPEDVRAVAAAPASGNGSWWFMGIVPVLGFIGRRLIGGMIA